jgi:hypothetical protein
MAAGEHLQPPVAFLPGVPRPRTRIHIDVAPEEGRGGGPLDFEVHLDVVVSGNGISDFFGHGFVGALQGLVNQGRDPNTRVLQILEQALPAIVQAGGRNMPPQAAPARREVRFVPQPNGNVVCQACNPPQTMPEAEASAHARLLHGAGQLHEEILTRPVPAPAQAPEGEAMVVAGTVENAAEGLVRVDGGVTMRPVPGYPFLVTCNGCGAEMPSTLFAAHANLHLRAPLEPPAPGTAD